MSGAIISGVRNGRLTIAKEADRHDPHVGKLESHLDLVPAKLVIFTAFGLCTVSSQNFDDIVSLVLGEEPGTFGARCHDRPHGETEQSRKAAFEDENPCPARLPALSIQINDGVCQKARECSSECCGGKEN